MKAKDLMVPLAEYLRPGDSVLEAARLLGIARRGEERVGVKALPVLDEDGKLVGILSVGDILKAIYPPYMYFMDLAEFTWDGMVETFAEKAAAKQVKDLMTRSVVTVREHSTLMECVDHMVKHNVKRLPVLDDEKKVVGMLYEKDVFCAITASMLHKKGGTCNDS